MKMKIGIIHKNEFIFYLGYISLLFSYTVNGAFLKPLTVFAIILFAIKIICTKYTNKEFLILSLFLILAGYAIICGFQSTIGMTFIIVVAMKNISFQKTVKLSFYLGTVIFLFYIFLSVFGILDNRIIEYSRIWDTENQFTRNSLGYSHPNMLYFHFFILLSQYLYLKFSSLNFARYIILILFCFLFYQITKSLTGIACSLLLLFLCMYYQNARVNKSNIIFGKYTAILCFLLSVISSLLYTSNNLVKYFDVWTSGRIKYGSFFINNFPVTMMGVDISAVKFSFYALLDNSYIFTLLNSGVLIMGLYLYIHTRISKQESMKIVLPFLIIFSIYGMFEMIIFNPFFNFTILLFPKYIYKTSSIEK